MGHICSYQTISQLQYKAAEKDKILSNEFEEIQQYSGRINTHHFAVKVVDSFYMNKENLHGQNSIHILNQVIIKTPENDEILQVSNATLNDIINQKSISNSPSSLSVNNTLSKSTYSYTPIVSY
ncbi:unnamed protein product [Adineta steineri]|uniref:Uncharacterized protein n=2 Tax=Adineta steineri TaxID=433720 RepID=A0A819WUI9_9BILA|nr:unnamed protein product [Adineta steineri]